MVSLLYASGLGLLAGLIPVYLGFVPLSLFRRVSASTRTLLVSISAGILVFLFADVISEAAGLAKTSIEGPGIFALGLVLGLGGPAFFVYRRRQSWLVSQSKTPAADQGTSAKFFTAYMISMGIGLHNFGEGLALGAAYAGGQLALTTVLVVGFALHNGTEGMGIAGPISDVPLRAREPLVLGFVAGFPTIIGSVLGSVAYSPLLGALFFAGAGGALLYVIMELLRTSYSPKSTFVGILVGVLIMYFTGLLLSV